MHKLTHSFRLVVGRVPITALALLVWACGNSDSKSGGTGRATAGNSDSAVSSVGGVAPLSVADVLQDDVVDGPPVHHRPVIDTIGSRIVVRNTADRFWAEGEEWTADLAWRVGEVNGPEQLNFMNITSLGVDPYGRVYVLDFGNQHIKVFTSAGEYVRTIGRFGRGPAEFNGALALAWDDHGHLWVPDGWNGRYTVFDSAGAVVKTVPRNIRNATGWFQRMLFVSKDAFVDETPTTVQGRTVGMHVLVDTLGIIKDTLRLVHYVRALPSNITPSTIAQAGSAFRELRPYQPRLISGAAKDGSVWLARSDTLTLFHVSVRGDTLRVVHTAHRSPELTRKDRALIADAIARAGLDRSSIAAGRQLVQAIRVLDDGHLLVQIEDHPGEAGHDHDVFDPEGGYLGVVTFRPPLDAHANAAVVADTVIGVTRDSLNVNYVVKFAIRRRGASR